MLLAVGGRVDSLSKREKPKARKKLKNAAHTHRQVHTVLGGLLLWDMALRSTHLLNKETMPMNLLPQYRAPPFGRLPPYSPSVLA